MDISLGFIKRRLWLSANFLWGRKAYLLSLEVTAKTEGKHKAMNK